MVVRNEAQRLGRCLDSIRSAVDEIVVVDTGSRDRTAVIAHSFGARVLHARWRDDFRALRELSFRQATGSWILFLDADEAVSRRDLPRLGSLCRGRAGAWRFVQRTYTEDYALLQDWRRCRGEYPAEEARSGKAGWAGFPIVRLFRNLPGVRCTNRVHATVEPWLQASGLVIRDAPFPLHHFQDQSPWAMRRRLGLYLRMNLKQVRDEPRDAWAQRDLGALLYAVQGNHAGALAHLRRAARLEPREPRTRALIELVLLDRERR